MTVRINPHTCIVNMNYDITQIIKYQSVIQVTLSHKVIIYNRNVIIEFSLGQ